MRTISRTTVALPAWVTWALAVPGVLAVCAALVDVGDKPSGDFPLRARVGVFGLGLLTLAWMAANTRVRSARR
ncbi:MAG: hypothetical protein M0Z98_08845 [Actinomycetales bacterium]|nr:hypothetical protein [Actinomycetales bacterium]